MMDSISYEDKMLELQIFQISATTMLAFAAFFYVAAPWTDANSPVKGMLALVFGIVIAALVMWLLHRHYVAD
jgi:F0F1-type ATP synthase assembly protein I